jgi:hypothetical protein
MKLLNTKLFRSFKPCIEDVIILLALSKRDEEKSFEGFVG